MSLRSNPPEVLLLKGILEICSKFTGEHPCRSVISVKLQSNFIEITLRHGCSPVNLLCIFRTPFPKNTSGGLLREFGNSRSYYIRTSQDYRNIWTIPFTFSEKSPDIILQ